MLNILNFCIAPFNANGIIKKKRGDDMKFPDTAKRLSDAMNKKHIKAAELAERSGVSKGSISQYLNGRNRPTNINAGKMAEVLNVDAMWLMGFEVSNTSSIKADYYVDTKVGKVLIEANKMDDEDLNHLLVYAQYLNNRKED